MNRACSLGLGLAALLASLAAVHGEDAKKPRTDLYGDPLPPGAVMRLGTLRLRHAGAAVAFRQDGKQLISCDRDGEVRVWDAASGALRRRQRLAWKAEYPRNVVLSPDGATAATCDTERVYLHDTNTGKESGRLPAIPGGRDLLLAFSANSKVLAVRGQGGNGRLGIQLWDVTAFKMCQTLKHPPWVEISRVAFAPDGKHVAGIAWRGDALFLWDAATGAVIGRTDNGVRMNARSLAFSPDGKTLAVGSSRRPGVRLLDAITLEEKAVLPAPKGDRIGSVEELTFSPDGRLLAATDSEVADGEGRGVLLWSMDGTKTARRLERKPGHTWLAFAANGKTLVCHGDWGSEIRLWDVVSGRKRHCPPGHDTPVRALAASADGRTIATGDGTATLRLWDAATSNPLRAIDTADASIHACFFSPDGQRIISAGASGTFQTWDVATGAKQRQFRIDWPPRERVELHTVRISADGKHLAAVASGGEKGESTQLFVWDLLTGKQCVRRPYQLEERHPWAPPDFPIVRKSHAALAPDGESLSVWLGDKVGFEETSTGCLLAALPKGVGGPLVFSPDGRLAAAAVCEAKLRFPGVNVKGVALIETASGEEVFRLEIGEFKHVAFTPDGYGVVVANKKYLGVWDTATGERLHQMQWPSSIVDANGEAKICSLLVLPDGRALTGMVDGDVLVWDLAVASWPARKPAGDLGGKELQSLWLDLVGDARKAHRAIGTLAAAPAQTVPFLKDHLRPAVSDDKLLAQLLADLDSDSFEAREMASRQLIRLRSRAEPMLRRALEGKPSLEMRRRIKAILAEPKRPPAEALRTLRAIAVLERIGTPEARRILEKLAGGAASPETRAAQQALFRLKYR